MSTNKTAKEVVEEMNEITEEIKALLTLATETYKWLKPFAFHLGSFAFASAEVGFSALPDRGPPQGKVGSPAPLMPKKHVREPGKHETRKARGDRRRELQDILKKVRQGVKLTKVEVAF